MRVERPILDFLFFGRSRFIKADRPLNCGGTIHRVLDRAGEK